MEELFDDEGVDEEFEIEGKGKRNPPCHALLCSAPVCIDSCDQ